MLVHRVFPHLPTATPGRPGDRLYEHRPQQGGRVDHPDHHVWYVASRPEVAVGETFGNHDAWDESIFTFPALDGARRALGVYRLPDDLRVLDLDETVEPLDLDHVAVREAALALGRPLVR